MAHNIEDRVFTISQRGMSRMIFGNQWIAREAPKRGLRDPWLNRPDGLMKVEEVMTKLGATDKEIKTYQSTYKECSEEDLSAWKAERDSYMRQRDEWIALQMFHKYGYEQFCLECETYGLTEEFKNSVRPCESKNEPQCNLFCIQYNNCKGDNEVK